MRGRGLLVLAGLVVAGHARAQTPAPLPVTLVAPANAEVASVRFAKLTTQELGRRGQPMVSEAEASSALGRPLSAAIADCSGDDLCYLALGQVVNAGQVLVLSAAFTPKDPRSYDCYFNVIDLKSGKARGQKYVTVLASEAGLSVAANTVAENVAPRPKMTAVSTPAPVIPAPTPVPVTTATPAPFATAIAAAPTPTPGVAGLDETAPKPPRTRPPLTKDAAFWGVAGAGALALGLGLFFGARSLEDGGGERKEGQSTVEVRF